MHNVWHVLASLKKVKVLLPVNVRMGMSCIANATLDRVYAEGKP
jgi:hypothetical protein